MNRVLTVVFLLASVQSFAREIPPSCTVVWETESGEMDHFTIGYRQTMQKDDIRMSLFSSPTAAAYELRVSKGEVKDQVSFSEIVKIPELPNTKMAVQCFFLRK